VWTLPSTDQPGAHPEGRGVEERGELDHPRAGTGSAVELDRRVPLLLLGEQESSSHLGVHGMSDREVAVCFDETADEAVCRTGRIGADEERMHDVFGEITGLMAELVVRRQRRDRLVQELEVIVALCVNL